MRRILTLGAVAILALTTASTIHARCCCRSEISYGCVNKSVIGGGVRWVLYKGVVLHTSMLTGTVVSTRPLLDDRYVALLPVIAIDNQSHPSLLRFTSETTPLVAGYITRILLDDCNRLWAFNNKGDASMYDGVSWETLPHQGRAKLSDWDGGNTADVIMRNGMIRIATSTYIDEIDVQHLKRTRLVDVGNGAGYPTFVGFDTVHLYGNNSLSFIDLQSDTASIVCERESTEDITGHATRLLVRTTYSSYTELQELRRAMFSRYSIKRAAGDLFTSMRTMGITPPDSIPSTSMTVRRSGAYLDMVADANGTVYIAGFDGITIIPSPAHTATVQEEESVLASIALFPNPASHHATIELPIGPAKETTAMLVDASGNTVYTLTLQSPATLLDLAALPVGMYTVVLTTEHSRAARSLIVQR